MNEKLHRDLNSLWQHWLGIAEKADERMRLNVQEVTGIQASRNATLFECAAQLRSVLRGAGVTAEHIHVLPHARLEASPEAPTERVCICGERYFTP